MNPDRKAGIGGHTPVIAVILALFVLSAATNAIRKDVKQGFDEVAHLSYVAHLQHSGEAWPRLEELRLLDPATFRFTALPNYLNHPPPFYWLLAHLGPTLEDHPGASPAHRLINVAMAAVGLATLLAIAAAAGLTRLETYAYCVPLAAIPVLAPLAGAVNNDNLAFAGGAVATFAAWRLLAEGRTAWLVTALASMIVAASAKLTGLMLVGTMMGGVLAFLLWRDRFQPRWTIPIAVAALAAAAPYLLFLLQYGSPAPDTAGQIALLKSTAPDAGWAQAPRQSFVAFAADFLITFVLNWMPTLAPRTAVNHAMLALPVAAVLCGVAGFALSAARIARRAEAPSDVIIVTGAIALAATFACHLVFSYRHHLAYASIADAYPRYYLPLAAIVPLAGLSLMSAVQGPRLRAAVAALLIAGPVLFILLGAPIGL
jgi:hypothetical protein